METIKAIVAFIILLAILSNFFPEVTSFVVGFAFLCGLVYLLVKLVRSVKDFSARRSISTRPSLLKRIFTRKSAPTPTPIARPKPPPLPPPVLPERAPGPIQGIMRVDVTQTARTVDVFIVLSEQAKHIVEHSGLLDTPIEENFEGLSEHLSEFSEDYDFETQKGIPNENPPTSDPYLQAAREESNRLANSLYQSSRQTQRKYKVDDEAEFYKDLHTVRLSSYLNNPYRKVVSDPLDATAYLKRLEKEYLPKIKAIIDAASPESKAQRSYDF